MIGRKKLVAGVFEDLKVSAAKTKRELHPSFKIELENYAQHQNVKTLPEEDLEIVLKGIGKAAIKKTASKILGGGSVRTVIVDLCDNPFSDCSSAAVRVLERADRIPSAKDMQVKLDKMYKPRGPR